jgi:hypothetical protein
MLEFFPVSFRDKFIYQHNKVVICRNIVSRSISQFYSCRHCKLYEMELITSHRNIWLLYLCCVYSLVAFSTACDFDSECNDGFFNHDKVCCHGTCISEDSTCISGAAIAGIVIGCLIIGGVVISCCLCFCCACGPFQNRSQGTVIRYGGHATQTTTTGVSSYQPASVQTGYGSSYPQPTQYPSAATVQGSAVPYPPQPNAAYPSTAPPAYDVATKPPPYNPGYPQ